MIGSEFELDSVHYLKFRILFHIFPCSFLDWPSLGSVYGTKAGCVQEKRSKLGNYKWTAQKRANLFPWWTRVERNGKEKRKEEEKKEGKREKLSWKHCEKRARKIYAILFHTKNYFGDIVMVQHRFYIVLLLFDFYLHFFFFPHFKR